MLGELSIAVGQVWATRGDVDANVAQHLRMVSAAAACGVQLLVFPELSLTGYELDLAERLAFSPGDSRLSPLCDAACNAAMDLIVGAPIRMDDRLHLGAFLIRPDGDVAIYTKRGLGAFGPEVNPGGPIPPPEAEVFVPGDRNPSIVVGGSTAAVGICAETLGPDHAASAARGGANIYAACHFGIPLDTGFRLRVLKGHAIRYGMAVAFANHGGPTGGLQAGGLSSIWSEDGTCVARLGSGLQLAVSHRAANGEWKGDTISL